jgi:hypothetical protein
MHPEKMPQRAQRSQRIQGEWKVRLFRCGEEAVQVISSSPDTRFLKVRIKKSL